MVLINLKEMKIIIFLLLYCLWSSVVWYVTVGVVDVNGPNDHAPEAQKVPSGETWLEDEQEIVLVGEPWELKKKKEEVGNFS